MVVLPKARELAGSAAHSGLAAAVRPAPPSLNMKRLERYDETKTLSSKGCFVTGFSITDSVSRKRVFRVFWALGVRGTFPQLPFYSKKWCDNSNFANFELAIFAHLDCIHCNFCIRC